jgi:hypothetical protein
MKVSSLLIFYKYRKVDHIDLPFYKPVPVPLPKWSGLLDHHYGFSNFISV